MSQPGDKPAGAAGGPMSDGERPGPGGWNRIHLTVEDLAAEIDRLQAGVADLPGRCVRRWSVQPAW
ncbi:hypothetical protein FJW06_16310 [Mesorhizobium sp. B4-1-3]|nr:hypothetical protein FJW06_16310 [Mesorhizobium sp. B4-1-3]